MPHQNSGSAQAPTPARLSVLSNSTLQALLELSRLSELSIAASPSARSKVVQNLTQFRNGLMAYRESEGNEIIEELRRQYTRIISLANAVDGMQDYLEPIELSLPGPTKLIDHIDDSDQAQDEELIEMGDHQNDSRQPLIKSHQLSVDFSHHLQPHPSLPSRSTIKADQEVMRNQNEDVQIMQRAMLDGMLFLIYHIPK